MTDQEILQKAIEKAVKNGWDYDGARFDTVKGLHHPNLYEFYEHQESSTMSRTLAFQEVIFSHPFAKAFWKDTHEATYTDKYERAISEDWQYHLQQMVLEENPIKYLEKFLDEGASQ